MKNRFLYTAASLSLALFAQSSFAQVPTQPVPVENQVPVTPQPVEIPARRSNRAMKPLLSLHHSGLRV